jgi:hypothetical protein
MSILILYVPASSIESRAISSRDETFGVSLWGMESASSADIGEDTEDLALAVKSLPPVFFCFLLWRALGHGLACCVNVWGLDTGGIVLSPWWRVLYNTVSSSLSPESEAAILALPSSWSDVGSSQRQCPSYMRVELHNGYDAEKKTLSPGQGRSITPHIAFLFLACLETQKLHVCGTHPQGNGNLQLEERS